MNSQLEKNRKPGSNYIRWGLILMAISVISFLVGLLYLNLIYIPAHHGPSEDLPAIFILAGPMMIEIIVFIVGALLGIVGIFKRTRARNS